MTKGLWEKLIGRAGRFSIAMRVIERQPSELMAILSKCVVVDADYQLLSGEVHYQAYCLDFDEVDAGAEVPEYLWTITYEEPHGVIAIVKPSRVPQKSEKTRVIRFRR